MYPDDDRNGVQSQSRSQSRSRFEVQDDIRDKIQNKIGVVRATDEKSKTGQSKTGQSKTGQSKTGQSEQYIVDCAIATVRNSQVQELFEKALDAIVVADDMGRYIDVNQAACDLFGVPKHALLGQTIADFAESGFDVEAVWQAFLTEGAARGEFRLVRPDGTVRDTEFAATAHVLPHQHLSILRDITARKQAEREKQALEQQCDMFFELSIDLLAIANLDGYFLHLNPAWQEVLGFSLDELKSRPFIDFVHPDDREATLQAIEHTKAGETIRGFENRYRTKHGSYRWVSWRAKPSLGYGLIYASARDVTDQKAAEQAVNIQMQRERALNQVVQAIRSSLELDTIFSVSAAEIACLMDGEVTIVQYLPDRKCWIHRVAYERDKEFFEKLDLEIPDEGNPFADQLKNHQMVCVDDTQTIDDPVNRKLAETSPGAWLLTPISIDGVVWGSLTLGRSHPNHAPWTEDDITLAQRVADQLAIAIHQAELYTQLHTELAERQEIDHHLRQYERVVSATPDGISLVDRHYIYQLVNETYLNRSQKQRHDIVGRPVSDIVGEEPFQSIVKPYLDRALAGETVCYSDWFTLAGVGRRFIRVTYSPFIEPDGTISGVVAGTHDQTELKLAEEEIHAQAEQERAFNRVVQIIRNSLDLDIIFATATREISQLTGISRVIIAEYMPDRRLWLHVAEYRQQRSLPSALGLEIADDNNPLADLLKQGEIARVEDLTTLDDPVNPALADQFPGAWLFVPIQVGGMLWGSLSCVQDAPASPFHDRQVELVTRFANSLAIAIQQSKLYQQVHDLNADLEAQVQERTAQLRASLGYEALLKRITDKVRDSLDEGQILQTAVEELAIGLDIDCCDTGLFDADKITSTIAYEFTKGWPSAVGLSFSIQPSHKPGVYQQLLARQDCQFCDISGGCIREVPYRPTILAVPIFDDQDILGDLWLFKDADKSFNFQEIRLVQQVANQCAIALRQARLYHAAQQQVVELERVNQMKDDFLSTVSHELRSPMANIKMASEMLELYLNRMPNLRNLPANIERYLQILKKECHRETTLINDLLDLARLESREIPLNVTSLQLDTWLVALAKTFEERAQKQRQRFQIHTSELVIETELTYLERIVTELLHNACKYTPAGEGIQISAQQEGDRLLLSVCNSGVEIPANECDRIFDKFYRIPNNDPWKQGGTGLGLALIKKLVQQLQGTICIHSQHQHTCFIVNLPLGYDLDR